MRPLDIPRRILAQLLGRIGAQHDYAIANADGASVRADINNALAAIVSNNSGATAPATTFAYMLWADTTTGLLKIRNAANSGWVTIGTMATTNLALAPLASPTFSGTLTGVNAVFSGTVGVGVASSGNSLQVSNAANTRGLEIDTSVASTVTELFYNRSGSAYINSVFDAAQHSFNISGSAIATITSTGLGVFCAPASAFDLTKSVSGSTQRATIYNSSNTASSDAETLAQVAGTSAGDPKTIWNISGGDSYVAGPDNSDSDKWELCKGLSIGTNVRIAVDTNGAVVLAGATPATGYTTAGDLTLPAARAVYSKNTAKAWIKFNGTGTPAADDSFNISSITDNGVGDYTLNFTNATTDAKYSVVGGGQANATPSLCLVQEKNGGTRTSSAIQIITWSGRADLGAAWAAGDFALVCVNILGG